MKPNRPVFLNLMRIRLPAAGVMSILHRASGVMLVLCIPLVVFFLQLILREQNGYDEAYELLSQPVVWLSAFLLLWALMHHFLAGIRYLLLDIHLGVRSPAYRLSAWGVMLAAPFLALLLAWRLLP